MDAFSLTRDLDTLEKSWSSLDSWLTFWTLLVVVGVAVELLVLVTEYIHDWRDFKRATIHTPEKPSVLIFGLGFVGVALVTIGVAGEFNIHTKAGRVESDMRSKNRELVGIAQREAGAANKVAGEANKEAAQLRKGAESLKKQAEDERMARVRIEERLRGRHLTLEQIRLLVSSVPHIRLRTIWVNSFIGDTEALQYAEELAGQLSRIAGMRIIPPNPRSSAAVPLKGLLVLIREDCDTITLADAMELIGAISNSRIQISQEPLRDSRFGGMGQNEVLLMAAAKP